MRQQTLGNRRPALTPGARFRVTLDVRVNDEGEIVTLVPGRFGGLGVKTIAESSLFDGARWQRLPDPEPKWLPGDVVVVRYERDSLGFTYVRGMRGWPGEHAAAKTDAEISRLWREGKATPVLQAGGIPFDERRLP